MNLILESFFAYNYNGDIMLEIFKNYLRNEEYYVILYSNFVYIYKYEEILKFTDKYISIKLNNLIINISGIDLLITKLESNELLIKGSINKLEKVYE